MVKVKEVLYDTYSTGDWRIEKPLHGSKKECYIASHQDKKVFVKFGVDTQISQHLSEMKITPNVMSAGMYDGETFFIQEYFDGRHPDGEWLSRNMEQVAALINIYHSDNKLSSLLRHTHSMVYTDLIQQEVTSLYRRLEKCNDPQFKNEAFTIAYAKFLDLKNDLVPVGLVPTHNEPNNSNMLVRSDQLTIIDWDDICLADPIRDVGPFLWWYIPARDWERFLRIQGISLKPEVNRRIFWYAARISLEVAIWQAENKYDNSKAFLNDFFAAVNFLPNPRGIL